MTKVLPTKIVVELAEHATRIRAALQRSLVEVGRELTEAKRLVSHGAFGKWVERECGMTPRTAQMIMRAYRLCLKNEKFSLLGRSALFVLGATDVPANTIAAIERRIAAGDVPRYADVRDLVYEARVDLPSPVSLALKMNHEPAKAPVIDLREHRILARARNMLAEAEHEGLFQRVQKFRDQIKGGGNRRDA
jgi:hypothetical protein